MDVAARAVAFGASVTCTAALTRRCGGLDELGPRDVPLQPPAWVFGVVWPLLYVTTGAAWAPAGARADAMLAALTLLCCAWLPAYVCVRAKSLAAIILAAATILATLAALTLRGASSALLAPLALWLSFASYLNLYDVLRQRPPPAST